MKTTTKESATASGMLRLNLRVPEHVHAQLSREAEKAGEDLSATVRRRLYAGLRRDELEARLEALDGKLDELLEGSVAEQLAAQRRLLESLAKAMRDFEQRLVTLGEQQASALSGIDALGKVYDDLVDQLNKTGG